MLGMLSTLRSQRGWAADDHEVAADIKDDDEDEDGAPRAR